MQYNDGDGQCPCRDALAFSHQKKGKPGSLRKLCEEPDCIVDRKKSKISVVNFSTWNHVFVFWTLPSSVFHISCFFSPCVVLIPCLFHVLLIISVSWNYFSWFSFINLLFGSLKNNLSFCFWTKVSKKYHWYSFYHFEKTLVFLSFINFCFWICSFMHDIQKSFCFFLCFHILCWRISGFFCLNLVISVQKKNLKKKSDSLIFSLVFLLTLFSLFCFVLCLLSLLLVFSFSTLVLFFLFPCFPLLMFASRYVFVTLSLVLPLLIPFFENTLLFILFFFFQKIPSFSFVHPFFVRLFLFHLLCCVEPFFFNRVLSNKINWLFSFGRKTTCLIPPRTYFLNFCYFFEKKSLSSFFRFFRSSLLKKLFFLNFSENSTQKWI